MQAVEPEPLMLLIPEDVYKPAIPGVFQREGRRARAVFENVRPGPYLLTVHTPPRARAVFENARHGPYLLTVHTPPLHGGARSPGEVGILRKLFGKGVLRPESLRLRQAQELVQSYINA